jgi:hypothetical protein
MHRVQDSSVYRFQTITASATISVVVRLPPSLVSQLRVCTRPLTAKAFKARKYSNKNIKVISQDEVDGYAKGEVLAK